MKFVHIRINVPDDTPDHVIQRIIDEAIIDELGIDPLSIIEEVK